MRLLTYNIHKGIGGRDRRYRLQRVIEVIADARPDLILLQEVDQRVARSHFHDQPSLLASQLAAADWAYQRNVQLTSGGYGNLLLSRWPFSSRHHISLRVRQKKPRGAQIVVVRTEQGPLQVVNWHLGLAEAERHWQVEHLLGHRLFRQAADLPAVIAGDFNDWRNTLGRAALSEHGFTEATAPPSRFRSFPAYLPLGSLDKLFYRGPVAVQHAHVIRSRLTSVASDHLPLVVDFDLR